MSGIESGEASQAKNSFEVDDMLEEDPQTKGSQSTSKSHKRRHGKEKKCAKRFKYLSGWSTTNMNLRLADEHDIVEFQKNLSNTKGSQQTITSMLQRVVPHKGVKKLIIYCGVAEWLVIDNRAFEVIARKGFYRFMLQVDPAFRWPSYKTLKKEIAIANVTAKNQINDLLAQMYIHPVMEAMKAHYAKNIDPDEYDYNNEVLQETSNFDSESESSDDENESDISFEIQENQTENDTELIKLIFGSAQRSDEFTDKLDSYLDLRQTPLVFSEKDPLLWW
ncbi:16591_t:CDS:2 [Dentiscutata heterogama]|uniref:16591_t:CDS:1 n=1 Tax=Dentiscutata heterogama TaxID=1316150 RepID=A0ACA9MZW9_9GLOM|nr:16591_t:CDS:2 [Dentiscutata heterogama]